MGHARSVEEGISTYIFGRGLERELFAGSQPSSTSDCIKTIHDFVRGFEPERCALWQWERAVLDGFKLLREFKRYRRGYIVADLERHTLEFREGTDKPGGFGWTGWAANRRVPSIANTRAKLLQPNKLYPRRN